MKKNKVSINLFLLVLCCFLLGSILYLEAATFTVTNTLDPPGPPVPGSLRDAIILANGLPGMDTIDFQIPPIGTPAVIRPLSQLPALTDRAGVLIDGFSQGGFPGPNPPSTANIKVELNGSAAGLSHGIWIVSPNNTIQGMAIDSFEQDGIRIEGTPDTTYNNYIYCNFLGTDTLGMIPRGNGWNRVSPWAGVNIIVGPGDTSFNYNNIVEGNLSSSNYAEGVSISNCPPGDNHSNLVLKNFLGTDIMGMSPLGNAHNGVYLGEGTHDNIVDSNLISDNRTEGVCIIGYVDTGLYIYTTDNTVSNNIIGLAVDHSPMGNWREGVSIGVYFGDSTPVWSLGYATNNIIGPNNIIAHNGRSGVMVWEHPYGGANADWNQITQNSIYDNGPGGPPFLGIDLDDDKVTLNDLNDPDYQANEDLNFPVIDSALYLAGNTTVYGRLDIDTDPAQATIEIFKANPDPRGYGEGEIYLGSVTPDGAGNWNVLVSGLNVGDSVTATTTDMNFNTSEFCFNHEVTPSSGIEEDASNEGELLKVSSPLLINSIEISFTVKKKGNVNLSIHDVTGKLIRNLVNEEREPSSYSETWDGKNAKGEKLPAGAYICNLESGDARAARKIIKIIK